MQKVFDALGGRSNALILVVITLLVVNDYIVHGSLQDSTQQYLLGLAGIGVAGRTVEDGVKAIAANKPTKK